VLLGDSPLGRKSSVYARWPYHGAHRRFAPLGCFAFALSASAAAGQSMTTYHIDNNRTGWNDDETILTRQRRQFILYPAEGSCARRSGGRASHYLFRAIRSLPVSTRGGAMSHTSRRRTIRFTRSTPSSNSPSNSISSAVSRPTSASGNPLYLYAFNRESVAKGLMKATGTNLCGACKNTGGDSNLVPVVANGEVFITRHNQLRTFGLTSTHKK
jgi:hypothetical protein